MEDRSATAYRDDVAAAYARIESLEAETRALRDTADDAGAMELLDRVQRLEAHARRWDRIRTTLAILLGVSVIVAMNISERFGSSAGLLGASIAMVAIGITVALPSLSLERAVGRGRLRIQPTKSNGVHESSASGVRVALSVADLDDHRDAASAKGAADRSAEEASPRSAEPHAQASPAREPAR